MDYEERKEIMDRIEQVREFQSHIVEGMKMLANEIAENRTYISELRDEGTFLDMISEEQHELQERLNHKLYPERY